MDDGQFNRPKKIMAIIKIKTWSWARPIYKLYLWSVKYLDLAQRTEAWEIHSNMGLKDILTRKTTIYEVCQNVGFGNGRSLLHQFEQNRTMQNKKFGDAFKTVWSVMSSDQKQYTLVTTFGKWNPMFCMVPSKMTW